MINRKPIIGVMGSSNVQWDELATPIGHLIAEHDYHLLTGAGGGVMTAVARAFTEVDNRAGKSIGIVPTTDYDGSFVAREQYPNPYIEIPILTPLDIKAQGDTNPYSRNQVNIMTSHALIILPGDHGTRNEASLGIHYNKQMILFGPEEEFTDFPEQPTRIKHIDEVQEFLSQVSEKFRKSIENMEG